MIWRGIRYFLAQTSCAAEDTSKHNDLVNRIAGTHVIRETLENFNKESLAGAAGANGAPYEYSVPSSDYAFGA